MQVARGAVLAALALAIGAGCASPEKRYVTTFQPQKEPSRTLDMSYEGPRANVAVSDFTVKARSATLYIGDGLREMLATALFESQRFNVINRQETQAIAAEQKLSGSRMAAPGSPELRGRMAVADLVVTGTVTEFEAEAAGAGIKGEMRRLPAQAGVSGKTAHMAIDVQITDTATGFVVGARRIRGEAGSAKGTIGATVGGGLTEMPASLGVFKNTPMELAIRDCIYRSVIYMAENLPPKYFQH